MFLLLAFALKTLRQDYIQQRGHTSNTLLNSHLVGGKSQKDGIIKRKSNLSLGVH